MATEGANAAEERNIQDVDLGDMNIDFEDDEELEEEAANSEEEENDADAVGEEEDDDADDSEDEDESLKDVKFDEKQQAVLDREIGKKVAKQREAERKAEALEQRIADLEAKLPKAERPEVPEIPDKDDDDYDSKIKEYNQAVLDAAAYDKAESDLAAANREQEESKQKELVEEFNKTIGVYAERSKKLGLKAEDLEKAGAVVAGYGLSDAVALHIIDEPLGPQITVYLSKNPQEAEALKKLTPMQAAVKISTDIKAAAMKTGKKADDTPEPPEVLNGGGAAEGDIGPAGVVYE